LILPGEHLMFRPIAAVLVPINRVIFGANYVGPHVMTFIKHILATLCLWWAMWKISPKWISALFALLFSVLVSSAFPVIWPHVNGYIITTIFSILAIITFRKVIFNQIAAFKGFVLTGSLLFLNSLSTELAILMPFVFFFTYWAIFRKHNEASFKQKDRGSWLMLLLPVLLWGLLYFVHLYFVRFHLSMNIQSSIISLWKPIINTVRVFSLLLSGIFFPVFIDIFVRDKIYFKIFDFGIVMLFGVILSFILLRKKMLKLIAKEVIFILMLIGSVLIIICFGRPEGIDRMLSMHIMATHYTYLVSALIILAIYNFLKFSKITLNKNRTFLLSLILALIVNHAFLVHQVTLDIQKQLGPLQKYFDSVREFVQVHKKESNFSFATIDRPPREEMFGYYHETCIDGLFNRFINNKNPKYLLKYSYALRNLKYSVYDNNYQTVRHSKKPSPKITKVADYVNSIGMQFKKVSGERYDFLMGMFEVTQKEWKKVMGLNPSRFKGDNLPVENVSYYMVQKFINRLNEIEGKNLYRLPIPQEYLYLINSGVDYKSINYYAWFKDSADGTTHLVGRLQPLSSGFYDLIGNVWEWTSEPIGLPLSIRHSGGVPRICFGGSWRDRDLSIYNLKLDNLITNYPPDFQYKHLGFRLVKEIKDVSK